MITINGFINTVADSTFRIEFFSNTTADATGYGEGENYLGATTVIVDGSGNATFSIPLNISVAAGVHISATATMDVGGNYESTSEFAANVVAMPNTEICNNSIDDDGDGLVDCNDPDCSGYYSMLISSHLSGQIKEYDISTGSYNQDLVASGLTNPADMAIGPDGMLYVSDFAANKIIKFNPYTGSNLGDFATTNLSGPVGIAFGPDNHLYVANFTTSNIVKFDGSTGAFISVFASGNGLNLPNNGLSFGPDGHLYVANEEQYILKFNGTNGAFIETFIDVGALHAIGDIKFGPDGNLYVSDQTDLELRSYAPDGSYLGLFTSGGSLVTPGAIAFDVSGDIYVTDRSNHDVEKYNGTTGAFISTFISAGNGLNEPYEILLVPIENGCQEICYNNIDDDGDGLVDCGDSDCGCIEPNVAI